MLAHRHPVPWEDFLVHLQLARRLFYLAGNLDEVWREETYNKYVNETFSSNNMCNWLMIGLTLL